MGERRGIRALVALVLAAAGLATTVSGPAAVAAGGFPDSCVEERYGDRVVVESYSNAFLADLDIGMPTSFTEQGTVTLVNGEYSPGGPYSPYSWRLSSRPVAPWAQYVVFDNQAPMPPLDPGPPPYPSTVRVSPQEGIPVRPPSGTPVWTVRLDGSYPRPVPFTATLTWSDCDADRDDRGDRYEDNCVGVNNPDQSDLDRDRKGDPCDPDDDNDGVADTSDNCPRVANADQTDWDGDRIGNACDASPGTAPPPPGPTPSSTCTTGCAYARTVGLRHRKAKHRFTGTVDSVAVGCRAGIEVTLWRKRSGDDRKLVVTTTKPTGAFRTKAPRRAGRYYATVGSPEQPLCGAASSRVVRIKRR